MSLCLLVIWQDFAYHGIAAFFYLSASVALAKVTLDMKGQDFQNYQLDISAVVRRLDRPQRRYGGGREAGSQSDRVCVSRCSPTWRPSSTSSTPSCRPSAGSPSERLVGPSGGVAAAPLFPA